MGETLSLQISLLQQLKQHKKETWEVRFSLNGQRLVSSDGEALYLWQLNEHDIWDYERSLPFRGAALPCFAPDGNLIAFSNQKKNIQLVSLEGMEIATLPNLSRATVAKSVA